MKINGEFPKQKKFELDLSFSQWLDYFSKEPTSKELDEMEAAVKKNPSQNNQYYHPLQGA